MTAEFMKGNVAIVHAARRAGCRCFFGYPITPSSEALEEAMRCDMKNLAGEIGVALQGEAEAGVGFMCYGAAATGERVFTVTSGPGMVWLQDAINYCATSEIPVVIIDAMRGGPALGNIYPSQSDYRSTVRPGGNGDYNIIVLAPSSVQELCDLTYEAFDLADLWRSPVIILTDGLLGQMKESVTLPPWKNTVTEKPWALRGAKNRDPNRIVPFNLEIAGLEAVNRKLQDKYRRITESEIRYESIGPENNDLLVISFGLSGRIMKSVLPLAEAQGISMRLIRPVTLWPFPTAAIREAAGKTKKILVAELNYGQMLDDVRIAAENIVPISFYGKGGGSIFGTAELLSVVKNTMSVKEA